MDIRGRERTFAAGGSKLRSANPPKNGSLFAAVSSGMAICPSRVMVLSEVTVIVFVRAS
jgi:hypothetical protein